MSASHALALPSGVRQGQKLDGVRALDAQVRVDDSGLGTLRACGTYIGVLLQLEHPADRVSILTDVMRKLGIDPEDVIDEYFAVMCGNCGMSDSPRRPCGCGARTRESRKPSRTPSGAPITKASPNRKEM